jgi:hypothetical protein
MSKFFTIGVCFIVTLFPLVIHSQSIVTIQPKSGFIVSSVNNGLYTVNAATGTMTLLTTVPLNANFPNALSLDTTRGIIYYDESRNAASNKAIYGYNYRTNTHFTLISDFTMAPGFPTLSIGGLGGSGATIHNGIMYLGAEWARSLSPGVPSYTEFGITFRPYSHKAFKVILSAAGTAITNTSVFKDYYNDHGEVNYATITAGGTFQNGISDADWGDFVIINDTIFERIARTNTINNYETITRAYLLNAPETKIYTKITSLNPGLIQTAGDLSHNLIFVGEPDGYDQDFVIANKASGDYNIANTTTMTLNGNTFTNSITDATGAFKGEGNIGNTIWYDINEDGIKQIEEIGIYDVPVEMWEDLDNDGIINIITDKLLGTAITDFAGHYEFKNALPGNYIIRVVMTASVNYPAQNFSATYTSNVLSSSGAFAVDAGDENIAGSLAKSSIKKNINTITFNDQSFDFGFSGIPFFLPLQNFSFTALRYNTKVQLKWDFTSKGDEDHFVLERSIDGIQFFPIENGPIIAVNNQIAHTTYDNNLTTFVNHLYYRLKILDKTGNSQMSNIIKVKLSNDVGISIYPNPTSGSIFISLSPLFVNKNLTIHITNSLGQVVKLASLPKANSVVTLNLKELSNGTYQCIIIEKGNIINSTSIQIK